MLKRPSTSPGPADSQKQGSHQLEASGWRHPWSRGLILRAPQNRTSNYPPEPNNKHGAAKSLGKALFLLHQDGERANAPGKQRVVWKAGDGSHKKGTLLAGLLQHTVCSKNLNKPERRFPTHPGARNPSLCQICHPTQDKCHGQQPTVRPACLSPVISPELQPHPTGSRGWAQKKAEAAQNPLSWALSRIKADRLRQYSQEAQTRASLCPLCQPERGVLGHSKLLCSAGKAPAQEQTTGVCSVFLW